VHPDHLGTPQRISDAGQTVVWDIALAPFGGVAQLTPSLIDNLRFPGQYADAETGLNYNYFRDYDPSIGRYVESDPIGLGGGVNTYAYVAGNPLSNIDPFGLTTITYDNRANTMTVTRSDGTTETFPAYNNAQSTSRGPWPEGTYDYDHHVTHPGDGPDSAYGSNGGYMFHVPGRSGMEVHSGRQSIPDRAGRSGPEHATDGCIRTNDAGTDAIRRAINGGDPVTGITVNR